MKRSLSRFSPEHIIFLILFLVILTIFFFMVKPFFFVILTSAIATIILIPIDQKLLKIFHHQKLTSFIIILGVFLCIFVPLIALSFLLISEASEMIKGINSQSWITKTNLNSVPFFQIFPEFIQKILLSLDLSEIQKTLAQWTFQKLGLFFQSTSSFIFHTFLFFISLFYFLVDRKKITNLFLQLSPLKDETDIFFKERMKKIIRSTVFGILLLAIIQGIFATLGMFIFHVPSALFWGTLTIFVALIPFVGTALILIPAVLYLFYIGENGSALGLFIWSITVVSLVDNLVGPFLIKGTTHMHTFLVMLALFGGLQFFGPIGVILGPTILATLITLLELLKPGLFLNQSTSK